MMIFLFVVGVIVLYLFFDTKSYQKQQSPAYKHSKTFKNLVGEDKLKIELTLAIEKVVETSLRLSKEKGYKGEMTNVFLISDINTFKERLNNNAFVLASQYKISSETVLNIIDTMCKGAIATYVLKL